MDKPFTAQSAVLGDVLTFEQMHSLLCGENKKANFLQELNALGKKPALYVFGYIIVDRNDDSDMVSPPTPFNFSNSPFIDRPARSTGQDFYPLIDLREPKLYAHQLRWFQHPSRKHIQMPLRFESYFFGTAHGTSRIYVDVPCIFKHSLRTLEILRVSLSVYDELLFAFQANPNNFVRLERKRDTFGSGVRTSVVTLDAMTEVDTARQLYNERYLPYYNTVRDFIYSQPTYRKSALEVADHLISLAHTRRK